MQSEHVVNCLPTIFTVCRYKPVPKSGSESNRFTCESNNPFNCEQAVKLKWGTVTLSVDGWINALVGWSGGVGY